MKRRPYYKPRWTTPAGSPGWPWIFRAPPSRFDRLRAEAAARTGRIPILRRSAGRVLTDYIALGTYWNVPQAPEPGMLCFVCGEPAVHAREMHATFGLAPASLLGYDWFARAGFAPPGWTWFAPTTRSYAADDELLARVLGEGVDWPAEIRALQGELRELEVPGRTTPAETVAALRGKYYALLRGVADIAARNELERVPALIERLVDEDGRGDGGAHEAAVWRLLRSAMTRAAREDQYTGQDRQGRQWDPYRPSETLRLLVERIGVTTREIATAVQAS